MILIAIINTGLKCKPITSSDDSSRSTTFKSGLSLIYSDYASISNRPTGFIHSDLFRDNTLFQGDQLQGILDFYELNQDEWLFDIAISINDFCTAYPQSPFGYRKAEAFLVLIKAFVH